MVVARVALVLVAVVLAGGVGCSGSGGAGGQPSGSVTVLAAASLTEPFTDAEHAIEPGLHVTYDFAGSQTLVQSLQQRAPADVVATADTATMQTLVDGGIVEPPTVFAHNRLEILVAPGNPKHVRSLADLARTDLTVVLCDTTVPAGNYARQILQRVDVDVEPKSLEPDVKAAVARVTSGEADATIVYVTDVLAAGARATGVELHPPDNVVVDYPIAIVKATRHRDAAVAFIEQVRNGAVRDALRTRGFEV